MTAARIRQLSQGEWGGRRFVDPAAWLAYAMLAGQTLFLAVVLASGRFTMSTLLVWMCFAKPMLFVLCAWAARWRGFTRIATFIEIVALLILGGALTAVNSLILAGAGLPLADDALAAADRLLFGFDRTAMAGRLHDYPAVQQVSDAVYHSASLSMLALFACLVWRGDGRGAWRVFSAFQIAALVGLCAFALTPAYGTPPYAYSFEAVLNGVRDGSIRTLDLNMLTGVITFPSMHAAGGVLIAWGLARLGRLAMPLVLLNIAMIGTAVTSGGHYLVDMAAGVALALLAIRLSGLGGRARGGLIPNARLRSSPAGA